MPLMQGKSQAVVSDNIRTEMNAGKPQRQAIAIAMNEAGKSRLAKGHVRPRQAASAMHHSHVVLGEHDSIYHGRVS